MNNSARSTTYAHNLDQRQRIASVWKDFPLDVLKNSVDALGCCWMIWLIDDVPGWSGLAYCQLTVNIKKVKQTKIKESKTPAMNLAQTPSISLSMALDGFLIKLLLLTRLLQLCHHHRHNLCFVADPIPSTTITYVHLLPFFICQHNLWSLPLEQF